MRMVFIFTETEVHSSLAQISNVFFFYYVRTQSHWGASVDFKANFGTSAAETVSSSYWIR